MAHISIIMLNFNGKEYLKRSIPAVQNLNYQDHEFIIVDNGSDDGSIEFIEKQNSIRLIKSPRYREKNFACNYAIEQAYGDFILLLDNDIVLVDPDIIQKLITMYTNYDKPGVIGLAVHDENINLSSRYGSYFGYYFIKEVKKYSTEQIKKFHGMVVPATGGQIFIRKSLWLEIGGYDSHLKFGGDDNDLGIRLSLLGYKNYLYSKSNQVHIGINERLDNLNYKRKFKLIFYAHLYTIVKNYRFFNMIISLNIYFCFTVLKAIKQALLRKHFGPISGFFRGFALFLKNLPHAIEKRKCIQKNRTVNHDIFLKIKPPGLKN